MRVTNQSMALRLQEAMREATFRRSEAAEQISSGRRVRRWSDAPTDAGSIVRIGAQQADWASFAKASDDALSWLNTQDSMLQDASRLMHRARELTIAAAQSTTGPGEREAIALEIEGLRDQMAGLANSTFLGRSVFGGFGSEAVSNGGGSWSFTGDSGQVQRRIAPDQVIAVNVDGAEVFGFNSGTDVFTLLDRVAANVRSGDVASLGNGDLDDISGRLKDVTAGLAVVGARTNQVEATQARAAAQIDTLRATRSSKEDADLAESVLQLSRAETGYEATLAVTARLASVSLVDFLR